MKLLKCIAINIITPLSYLINLYLETGIVPAILNISRIERIMLIVYDLDRQYILLLPVHAPSRHKHR